jgi:WD40 repeat protein
MRLYNHHKLAGLLLSERLRHLSAAQNTRSNWRLISLCAIVGLIVILEIVARRGGRLSLSDVPHAAGVKWLRRLALPIGNFRAIALSSDGSHVAAAVRGEGDLKICVWQTADGKRVHEWPVPDWTPGALALSANGQFIACGLYRRRADDKNWEAYVIVLGRPAPGAIRVEARFAAGDGVIASLAFSPDARRLAVLKAGSLAVYDAPDWQQTIAIKPDAVGAGCVVFSPDGKTLAAAMDRYVEVLDLKSQKWQHQWKQPYGVQSVAFSPDGHDLAAIVHDAPAIVWNLATSQPIATLVNPPIDPTFNSTAGLISFTKSGDRLLTFRTLELFGPPGTPGPKQAEGTVELWEMRNPQSPSVLIGPTASVRTAVFSPSAGLLATTGADDDATMDLWDLSGVAN